MEERKFNSDSEKGMMNWGKTNRNREERAKNKRKTEGKKKVNTIEKIEGLREMERRKTYRKIN